MGKPAFPNGTRLSAACSCRAIQRFQQQRNRNCNRCRDHIEFEARRGSRQYPIIAPPVQVETASVINVSQLFHDRQIVADGTSLCWFGGVDTSTRHRPEAGVGSIGANLEPLLRVDCRRRRPCLAGVTRLLGSPRTADFGRRTRRRARRPHLP